MAADGAAVHRVCRGRADCVDATAGTGGGDGGRAEKKIGVFAVGTASTRREDSDGGGGAGGSVPDGSWRTPSSLVPLAVQTAVLDAEAAALPTACGRSWACAEAVGESSFAIEGIGAGAGAARVGRVGRDAERLGGIVAIGATGFVEAVASVGLTATVVLAVATAGFAVAVATRPGPSPARTRPA